MKIETDLNDNLFDEACSLTGMCCLLMAIDGEEINRTQLTLELMRLHGTCIGQAGQCPPPLLLPLRS
ncbi:hypothetical protein IAE30_20890 [Pantoea sp. S61]|uniref:hypothetical protein n=1 Tax=Pantoea sp. S61 TaxID=2767442 RepID=UPI001909FA0F|nr:hypothetical protein [Pantoea sp. S61]MBK0126200.1 hypothetical protein [Pantoea sp. S61]